MKHFFNKLNEFFLISYKKYATLQSLRHSININYYLPLIISSSQHTCERSVHGYMTNHKTFQSHHKFSAIKIFPIQNFCEKHRKFPRFFLSLLTIFSMIQYQEYQTQAIDVKVENLLIPNQGYAWQFFPIL